MAKIKVEHLSASVSVGRTINEIPCEIACYGGGHDFVCRITREDSKPIVAQWNDGYHPPRDAGLLWIRTVASQCLITGFVQQELFPNCDALHDLLETIQALLTVDQAQPKVNVQVIGKSSVQSLEFNGEQVDVRY